MTFLMAIFSLLVLSMSVNANIYRYIDENGKTHFTDKRLSKKHVAIEYSWKGWTEVKPNGNYSQNRKRFKPFIQAAAAKYGINEHLIHAVIHTESHYRPEVKSKAGAVGLMQLMPATAKRFGVNNRKNPEQNIHGGVKYLKVLMKMFDGDLTLVLAAYNAGEGAVRKYGNKIPPYPETQNYVKKVLKIIKAKA